jgi:hypothetical protein
MMMMIIIIIIIIMVEYLLLLNHYYSLYDHIFCNEITVTKPFMENHRTVFRSYKFRLLWVFR